MPEILSQIVEVCVFSLEKGQPRYLLLKRSKSDTLYPGIWQMVTGVVDPGEKATEAALRELREETGVSPVHFWVVPYSNSFYVADGDVIQHTAFFAAEIDTGAVLILSNEHQSFLWATYSEALSTLVWPGQKKGLEIVHEYIVGEKPAGKLLEITSKEIRKEIH
jgi:8-oxo-dGTP pyrophosphatase MutT (NUDIX family)